MSKHPKTDMYRRDRDSGMTYRQIAAKYGVSYQCVSVACGRNGGSFRPFDSKQVVYPNLRKWLNENKVTKREFVRRMDKVPSEGSIQRLTRWFNGSFNPNKETIDNALSVTGMSYEELFAKPETEGEREECADA